MSRDLLKMEQSCGAMVEASDMRMCGLMLSGPVADQGFSFFYFFEDIIARYVDS